jgi:hypothetical protein
MIEPGDTTENAVLSLSTDLVLLVCREGALQKIGFNLSSP